MSLNWRPPWLDRFSFDANVTHSGAIVATRDNLVEIPARTLINLGGRYRFTAGNHAAALRAQISNVTNEYGFALAGGGAYDLIPGAVASVSLAVDF